MKQAQKKRRKIPALDKYVIFSLSCIIVFTVVILCIFWQTGSEPTALVTCFFAAFAGELLSLALIKRLKLRQEYEAKADKIPQFKKSDVESIDNTDAFG